MKTGQIFRTACRVVLLAMVFSIALSAQSGGGYIKGVVQSPSGKLRTSVWVTVSQNGVEKGRSLTGDDGKYYIRSLDGGGYDVLVLQGTRQLFKGYVNLPGNSRFDILIR